MRARAGAIDGGLEFIQLAIKNVSASQQNLR